MIAVSLFLFFKYCLLSMIFFVVLEIFSCCNDTQTSNGGIFAMTRKPPMVEESCCSVAKLSVKFQCH